MKSLKLKEIVTEIVEAAKKSSTKMVAHKGDGGWKIYHLGLNPEYPSYYIDVKDETRVKGFDKEVVEKYSHAFLHGATVYGLENQIKAKEDVNRLYDVDIIKGETIISIEGKVNDDSVRLLCASGISYDIDAIPDDNATAWISKIDMDKIIGKKIIDAYHEGESEYGVDLIFKAEGGLAGLIEIEADHNGYYGFSYHVRKRLP